MQITTSILVSYAHGLLAPNISQQVKDALLADEMLRWQYEGILQLMKDYPDDDPEELIEKMAASISLNRRSGELRMQGRKVTSSRNWLLMAAVFIIVMAFGAFIIYHNNQPAEKLAAQMIKEKSTSPYESATRGSLSINDTVVWKNKFADNDFQSAISLLEQKENKNPEEQFFLAVSYLRLSPSQPEKAEPLLVKLTKQETVFSNEVWLYLGLTQTLLDQKEKAIASLQHVEQTAQVKDLKERLRK